MGGPIPGPGDRAKEGQDQASGWRPNVMATEFVSQTIDAEDMKDVNNNMMKLPESSISDLDEVDVLGGTFVVTKEKEVKLVSKAKE